VLPDRDDHSIVSAGGIIMTVPNASPDPVPVDFVAVATSNEWLHWYRDLPSMYQDGDHNLETIEFYNSRGHRLAPQYTSARMPRFLTPTSTRPDEAMVLQRFDETVRHVEELLHQELPGTRLAVQGLDLLSRLKGKGLVECFAILQLQPFGSRPDSSQFPGVPPDLRDPAHNLFCHGIWP
jgi:hypothetical protein